MEWKDVYDRAKKIDEKVHKALNYSSTLMLSGGKMKKEGAETYPDACDKYRATLEKCEKVCRKHMKETAETNREEYKGWKKALDACLAVPIDMPLM
ncbi:MAG: hypothetical protein LUD47_07660 [Clostridia bacterium]|nr:hypothetical protein [Clostridia bacterium]